MLTSVRIAVLVSFLLLGACSSFRLNDSNAFITTANLRFQQEPPIVAVRLLNEPLTKLLIMPLADDSPQPVVLDMVENILFESDSAILSPTAIVKLDSFAIAVGGGNHKILIEGYADNSHNHEHNLSLSEARAIAVKEALIARGVAPERLVVNFYGETEAVASNTHEFGRLQNRRVELRIITTATGATDSKPRPKIDIHSQTPLDGNLKPLSTTLVTNADSQAP